MPSSAFRPAKIRSAANRRRWNRQERLHLRNFPRRIECFDMSNIQGTNPVGSMVAFTDGEPDKARYRKFQVKTVEGPDDFASMYEVLSRRYTRALEEDDLPDLIMVDGGKGQLNIAQAVLWELGIETPDLISIAKSRLKPVQGAEEKHRTDERFSFRVARTRSFCRPIPRDFFCCSGFAMKRIALPSPITKAAAPRRPCIRPSTTSRHWAQAPTALLRHFGSVNAIAAASPEAIQEVAMVSRNLAEMIIQSLQKEHAAYKAVIFDLFDTPGGFRSHADSYRHDRRPRDTLDGGGNV